jgi:hypothetical protein
MCKSPLTKSVSIGIAALPYLSMYPKVATTSDGAVLGCVDTRLPFTAANVWPTGVPDQDPQGEHGGVYRLEALSFLGAA